MSSKKKKPVPKHILEQNRQQVQTVHQQTAFAGPLPSPDDLAKYAAIDPDMVNRIVTMAENESNIRHENEKKAMTANINITTQQLKERKTGQVFGLVIGLSGLLSAVALGYFGLEVAASIVGGTTVTGLVGIFVIGQYFSRKK